VFPDDATHKYYFCYVITIRITLKQSISADVTEFNSSVSSRLSLLKWSKNLNIYLKMLFLVNLLKKSKNQDLNKFIIKIKNWSE